MAASMFPGMVFQAAALTAALLLTPAFVATGGEKVILRVYTWSDYFDDEALARFEDAHNCHVAIDYFDSNEDMYAGIKAGRSGYDIATPSTYMSTVMNGKGMLLPLDHAKLTRLDHLNPGSSIRTEDPEMRYSVPYTRTVSGIGYNRAQLGAAPEPSWGIFGRGSFVRRVTMLDDMRETIGAALKFLGHSLNTTDEAALEAAGKQLAEWRKNLAGLEIDEAKLGLGAGEFLAIHGYNGDVALIMRGNRDIGFFVPEEGSSVTFDDFVILADSPNPDLAHAFIDHFLDPEIAAINMKGIQYYMPNPEAVAMLPEELWKNPAFHVDDDTLAKCEVIRDLGPDNAKYEKIWAAFKAGE